MNRITTSTLLCAMLFSTPSLAAPITAGPHNTEACFGKICAGCRVEGLFAQCFVQTGSSHCYVEVDPDGVFGECGKQTWMLAPCSDDPTFCALEFAIRYEPQIIVANWLAHDEPQQASDFGDLAALAGDPSLACSVEEAIIIEDAYGNPREESYDVETCCADDGLCCSQKSKGGGYGCDCSGC